MATFIVLAQFGAGGVERLRQVAETDPTLHATFQPLLSGGMTVHESWLTTGDADMVIVLEAPSLQRALAFAAAFGVAHRATTNTLSAVSTDAIKSVLEDAQRKIDAHTKMFGHTKMDEPGAGG